MMLSTAVLLGLTLGGLEIDSHNWSEMATLTPTTVDEGGYFGYGIASSGTVVIIGSPLQSAGQAQVTFFSEAEPGFDEVIELEPSDGEAGDYFGSAVAVGDLATEPDEDGGVAFVGAFGCNGTSDGGTNLLVAGAVYMYQDPDGSGSLVESIIIPLDQTGGQNFGLALDFDASRLVVGAPGTSTTSPELISHHGCVYVYEFDSTGTMTSETRIDPPTPADQERFGYSVAIDGDRLVVGELYGSDGVLLGGAVQVYDYQVSVGWTHSATLVSDDPSVNSYISFGYRVDLQDDMIVVSEVGYDSDAYADVGAVFVFKYDGMNWTQSQRIDPPIDMAISFWGTGLSLFSDPEGGDAYLAIGAQGWTNESVITGAAAMLATGEDGLFEIERMVISEGAVDLSQVGANVVLIPELQLMAVSSIEVTEAQGGWVSIFATTCSGDATGDELVNADDILEIVADWGEAGIHPSDLVQDYSVNLPDLLQLLADWGCNQTPVSP